MPEKTLGAHLHLISLNLAREMSHGVCVSNLCVRVGREMRLSEPLCHDLAVAGFVHDIGKLRLESFVYNREEETLTIEEMRYVRMHADLGAQILREKGYPDHIVEWVHCHHENCDGSGYPRNLKADQIPLGAKIIRVCDVFAALTEDRLYRKAFDPDTAVDMMISESKYYDLKVFLAFLGVIHSEDEPVIRLVDSHETEALFAALLKE